MTGSGTLLDPYVIWDVNDVQDMALDLTAYYELGQDIDAAATTGWNWDAGLGIFKGFDPIGKRDVAEPIQRPTGTHSSAGAWTIFPADGILWDKVNEAVPDEDAGYIQGTVDDTWALFNFPNFAIPANATEIVVRVYMRAKKIAAGTCYIRGYLRVGGSNYSIATWNPDVNYSDRAHAFASNPVDWSDWTPDQVNGIGPNHIEAFGVRISDATPNIRVTQVYISVEYSTPFSGHLDGKGHTINGLYINRPNEDTACFGYVDLAAKEIKNLNFTNANIRGKRVAILACNWETGNASFVNVQGQLTVVTYSGAGLIETVFTSGTFSNCNIDITISGGANVSIAGAIVDAENAICTDVNVTISSHTTGGGDNNIGGFAGIAWGTSLFTRCSARGTIYSEGWGNYGGFLAFSDDPMVFTDCSSAVSITVVVNNATGGINAGGFAGYSCSDEQYNDCYARGDISVTMNGNCTGADVGGFISFSCTAEQFTHCHASGNITIINNGTSGADVGGFVSFSSDQETYSRCGATGNITFTNNGTITPPVIGGFAGYFCSEETYDQCYAAGNIIVNIGIWGGLWHWNVGGFAGESDDETIVTNCYSLGNITVVGDNGSVAGFVGCAYLGAPLIRGYFQNCYSKGKVAVTGAGNQVGGCIMIEGVNPLSVTGVFWDAETSGQATSDAGIGKTTSQMHTLDTFASAGWDIESSLIDKAGGYPYLAWQSVWYIFVAAAPPPPISVMTLPATEIR